MTPPRDADSTSGPLQEDRAVRALTQPKLGAGRVSTYAALGAVAGAVPLPFLPDLLAKRVRGALAQDVAGRHGLSITPEARAILAAPAGSEASHGLVAQGARFVAKRVLGRFGPLAILPPVRAALETFVLGHLLARYLDGARTERAARIDVDEARRLRRAIDQATIHALSTSLRGSIEESPSPAEELRDPVTKLIDGALITAAGVPGWVVRRIETAFDEVMPRSNARR